MYVVIYVLYSKEDPKEVNYDGKFALYYHGWAKMANFKINPQFLSQFGMQYIKAS